MSNLCATLMLLLSLQHAAFVCVCVAARMKDVRLAVLKDLYWRRTEAQDKATNKRLDLLCAQLQEELDVKTQRNHHNHYRGQARSKP